MEVEIEIMKISFSSAKETQLEFRKYYSVQGVSEKIVHSIFHIVCVLAPVLLRSQKNGLGFHKI
jgi:hypothetical protein